MFEGIYPFLENNAKKTRECEKYLDNNKAVLSKETITASEPLSVVFVTHSLQHFTAYQMIESGQSCNEYFMVRIAAMYKNYSQENLDKCMKGTKQTQKCQKCSIVTSYQEMMRLYLWKPDAFL